ncbi:carbohydrate kinase [Rhizobium leguminosarum]|uniref:FGGY-family carbohydrate kinase n=1 Tax=Rhizobium leguminosarum TaxID=384 RepID=UPI001C9711F0|nr:FGGY-family carbohydrate kinase [Rhizobium leguminosarum]MBY5609624.1 carbohydrate kinase [Rhizobium leguminosarum]MBY5616318.1 carbohydrate kinase [Rhizobium leguminosarum]MBY5655197.1 carbohydrate kinase [Rhizobium leguminosarum]MBY5671671.1 carbohydrate kinase [Rhizobium leguminosarum]MBY5680836.1 carbohydrate kinase [Rhizobium leguminosarum]
MGNYLLGLDAGNTVIKAVIFDRAGNEIAAASAEGHSRMPSPGHVERGLDELWTNARQVIRACIEKAKIKPEEIAAIGCAGHGNGLYALDRDGAPLIGIQSLDTRAAGLVDEWREAGVGDRTYPIARQRPWPSQTPTLLAWLKRHRPELFNRIGTVFFSKDFVVNRLTGRRVSEVSDMSGAGLLDLAARRYDRALMEAYGLGDCMDLLPPLIESADIAGAVTKEVATQTGLAAGTPVVGGLFDVVASALGSGVSRTGSASIIAGTWSINQVVIDSPDLDGPVFMSSTFDRTRYMAMENSATSAANLEWLVREFFEGEHAEGVSPFDACCALAGAIEPAADDPLYHPYLYGAQQDGHARAGFYGIAGWHTRGHLVRALLEGVAFGHRQHIETIRKAGAVFNEAMLSGGGSRSLIWPQIFADVLGVPVTVARSRETGALGAAIAAGTGVGIFADFGAGAAAMVRTERRYRPDVSLEAHYARRYALYRDIAEAMAPLWRRLTAVPPVAAGAAA